MVRAKKNAVLAWTTFLTLALAVPGCKQKIASDDGSSVQTLDNFARKVGTPIRQNHCGPSSATAGDRSRGLIVKEENIIFPAKSGLWADERVHEQLKKEVYGVLSQLPPSLLALCFSRYAIASVMRETLSWKWPSPLLHGGQRSSRTLPVV